MEAKATAKFVRVSSRKAKLVADAIRGKSVGEALSILQLTPMSLTAASAIFLGAPVGWRRWTARSRRCA